MIYEMEEQLKKASRILRNAEALLISAGAGIGVDSGLPDFRGNEGFWKAYPPLAKLGRSFVQMATPDRFYDSPKLAWGFYGHRLNLYRRIVPHAGFSKLLNMAQQKPEGYFVFTSNVDGQFQKAGYEASRIVECHGSIHYFQCIKPCGCDIWDAGNISIDVDEKCFEAVEPLPRCIQCGSIARPNILMFGDWSWNAERTDIQERRFREWLKKVLCRGICLVVLEIGAGRAVATVRHLSEQISASHRATLIRINPRDYDVSDPNDISIPLGALEAINDIVRYAAGNFND